MGFLKILAGALVVAFAVAFTYYNLQPGEVKFYNYSVKLPMFILVFLSVGIGFTLPVIYYQIREKALKRREEKILELLNLFWREYFGRAFGILRRFLTVEEFVPLYVRIKKELEGTPDLQLDLYNKGIAETSLAEIKFRKSLEDAKILLENALGKNQKNQRARKMLRSVYMGFGEWDKAEDLQREVLKEIEKERKPNEERVLASIIAEKYLATRDEALLKELWKLPLSKTSAAVLASKEGGEEIIDVAHTLGILNEVVKIMEEKNLLNPKLINLIEKYREELKDEVLYYIYLKLNMHEKLSDLRITLRELNLVKDKGRKLLELVRIWECDECGKEYTNYSSVCTNCLGVNTLKIKSEGAEGDSGPRKEAG
ncbi:MAG: preprotein translocase subunit TatC [Aquificae bacterium]|nr:preprotein translocase subunit TatC [Aquificota bacterium]